MRRLWFIPLSREGYFMIYVQMENWNLGVGILENYCQYSGRDSNCVPILVQCRYTSLFYRNLELILQVHRLDIVSLWVLFNFASTTVPSVSGVNCLGPFAIVLVSLRANMLHIRLVNRVNFSALNVEAASASNTLLPIFTASCRRRQYS